MFNELEHLADQIRRSWDGPAWHGPAVSELVKDVNTDAAERRLPSGSHSIREIVQHITSWESAVVEAIHGALMPDGDWAEDWPESGAPWASVCLQLRTVTEKLVQTVREMPSEQLADTVPGRDFDYRFLLSGVPQHNAYHGGQIALLKKL